LSLAFNNLLPGEPQSVTVNYKNTGTNPQDVWIVFQNVDALHAINDLGTYGEVTVANNGNAVFHSVNLNDKPNNGTYPLPQMIRLSQNVAPGEGGTMTFTFAYAGKLTNASNISGGGAAWNYYPLGSTANSGLPYEIVATQVGQNP
jgi:hypothetical protein